VLWGHGEPETTVRRENLTGMLKTVGGHDRRAGQERIWLAAESDTDRSAKRWPIKRKWLRISG
jgi:hypothetical protein